MAKSIPLARIVLDWSFYPRHDVDPQHAGYIEEAIRTGHEMPPVVVEKDGMRLVDGFHRYRATTSIEGEEGSIQAVIKPYASDAEILADAMRYNASHGKALTTFDRARCLELAKSVGLAESEAASILHWSQPTTDTIKRTRYSGALNGGKRTPLKRTIEHKAGQKLTEDQLAANEKLSGMRQSFYVNQVLLLLDNDLINIDDERLMQRLALLQSHLAEFLGDRAA